MIDHAVETVYNGTKIIYHAQAAVNVGKSLKGFDGSSALNKGWMLCDADQAYQQNKPTTIQLLHNELPARDAKLNVQSAEGWAKTFTADLTGHISFIPVWKGNYLLEGSFTETATGKHADQEFTSVWHCVTNCVSAH